MSAPNTTIVQARSGEDAKGRSISLPIKDAPASTLHCNACCQSPDQAESKLKFIGQPDSYRLRAQCRLCGSPMPDWKVSAMLQQ